MYLCTTQYIANSRRPQRYRVGAIYLEGTRWNGTIMPANKRVSKNIYLYLIDVFFGSIKMYFFGKKTTCLSTFRISHISHFRKSSRSKDWMGSISSSPICWFFQHLKHLNSTISCSPCPALIYRPRLQWMGISANYPCLSTHFVLWYLFIYTGIHNILVHHYRQIS